MLDELPFGCFLEIEGADLPSIQQAAAALDLAWDARVQRSYLSIVKRLRGTLGFAFSEITFANFEQMDPIPSAALQEAIGQAAGHG